MTITKEKHRTLLSEVFKQGLKFLIFLKDCTILSYLKYFVNVKTQFFLFHESVCIVNDKEGPHEGGNETYQCKKIKLSTRFCMVVNFYIKS